MDFLHLILNIILNFTILRVLFMKFTIARWFPMIHLPAMNPVVLLLNGAKFVFFRFIRRLVRFSFPLRLFMIATATITACQ